MSQQHTVHRDVYVAGLADDCPRCSEHSEHPFRDLDDEMLAQLVRLALDPERLQKGRSYNELRAAKVILDVLEQTGRIAAVAPVELTRYLNEKWRLPVEIRPQSIRAVP